MEITCMSIRDARNGKLKLIRDGQTPEIIDPILITKNECTFDVPDGVRFVRYVEEETPDIVVKKSKSNITTLSDARRNAKNCIEYQINIFADGVCDLLPKKSIYRLVAVLKNKLKDENRWKK